MDTAFVYETTQVSIPINTIPAWSINIYLEHGNMIIPILLLPLVHISNSKPLLAR